VKRDLIHAALYFTFGCLVGLCAYCATQAFAQEATAHYRRSGVWLLPDSTVTPGVIETSDAKVVCNRTTAALRHVTPAMHHAIFAAYGIPWDKHALSEDDHLVALELGGANDNANRWPQPYPQAHVKDSVENWAHRNVCAGRLPLPWVQHAIAANWSDLWTLMHRYPKLIPFQYHP
jgi:hypothetical protein